VGWMLLRVQLGNMKICTSCARMVRPFLMRTCIRLQQTCISGRSYDFSGFCFLSHSLIYYLIYHINPFPIHVSTSKSGDAFTCAIVINTTRKKSSTSSIYDYKGIEPRPYTS
jgi:hypothetical protein